jgi:hypothetical protein
VTKKFVFLFLFISLIGFSVGFFIKVYPNLRTQKSQTHASKENEGFKTLSRPLVLSSHCWDKNGDGLRPDINSHWTLEATMSGNVNNWGTYNNKSGLQQVYTNPEGYNMATLELCTPAHGVFSISFYDDYDPAKPSKGTAVAVGNALNNQIVGVGVWTDMTDKYMYRVHNTYSPQNNTISTGIKRTRGWHKFELISTPVGTYGRIDDINLTWLPGKKTAEGFTYNINIDSGFNQSGVARVKIVSTWALPGNNTYAELHFTPLESFKWNNSLTSMADLSNTIAQYFFKQYPYAKSMSFYRDILAAYRTPGNPSYNQRHTLTQEFNHLSGMAMLLGYDYRTTGNRESLNYAKEMIAYVAEHYSEWQGSNTGPYTGISLITAARLIWDSLDSKLQISITSLVLNEGRFFLMVNLNDPLLAPISTNPWGSTRNHLPFQRPISESVQSLMNSATRDNAWVACFYRLAADFPQIASGYPEDARNFRTMSDIIAYHSLTRVSDPAYGIHPLFPKEGTISVSRTILDNYNMPTVWSNPNPFYSYLTVELLAKGLLLSMANGNLNITPEYTHNWKPVLDSAEKYIEFATNRSKSGLESIPAPYQPAGSTYELYGKGSQTEDFSTAIAAFGAGSVLPAEKTHLDQNYYQQKLFNELKYEFYTLGGYPREPWFANGTRDGAAITMEQAKQIQVGPMDGWTGSIHLNMIIDSVIAINHIFNSLMLNPGLLRANSPQLHSEINAAVDEHIDAMTTLVSGGVQKFYIYKNDRVWLYQCANGICSATYTKTIIDLLKSVGNQTVWNPAVPTNGFDAVDSFTTSAGITKVFFFKGDRIWTYQCVGGVCSALYTKTIADYLRPLGNQTVWNPAVPTNNFDSVSTLVDGTSFKTYIIKGNRVWSYQCASNGCNARFVTTLADQFRSLANLGNFYLPMPIDRVDGLTISNDGNTVKEYLYKDHLMWQFSCSQGTCTAGKTTTLADFWWWPVQNKNNWTY